MEVVLLSLTLDCQQFLLKGNNATLMLQGTCIPIKSMPHKDNRNTLLYIMDPSRYRNMKSLPFLMSGVPTFISSMGIMLSGNCSCSNSESVG